MSRPSLGLVKAVASSSRSTLRQTPRNYATQAQYTGNITSVDPRVLSGMDHFLPKHKMDDLCEWQKGLWERLQAEVRNNVGLLDIRQKWDRSGIDMTQLVSATAPKSELTLAYNYGALLLNNSYFLENLNADDPQSAPDQYKHLEDRVATYADAMVSSGYLWIVQTGTTYEDLDILPTFGAGTLLVANRSQRGRSNLPIFMAPSTSESVDEDSSEFSPDFRLLNGTDEGQRPRAGAIERRVRSAYVPKGGVDEWPMPLACLNMFESCWHGGKYKVWDRERYARDWWHSLDWSRIMRRSRFD